MTEEKIKKMSSFAELARKSVEAYIKERKIISAPMPLPEEMKDRAGVFVCLKKKGNLRGCIGTILATKENIADEIIHNAVSAATGDPRFSPVSSGETGDLHYSVDILTEPESVDGFDKLNPGKYGVIVKSGYKTGLLLPDLEGVDTVDEQVSIAMQKAGILPGEPVELFRFEVKRYE